MPDPLNVPPARAQHRRLAVLLATMLVAILATLVATVTASVTASAAGAQEAFRFWGYYAWQGGKWEFSQVGPDQTKPAEGAVEGWRFAVSPPEASPRVPRATGDFSAICGSTAAVSGKKRVAVVIDYGVPAEAPKGETPPQARGACAVVAAGADGVQVLQAVAPVRAQEALVCAIDGYPRTECGAPYDGPLPDPTATEAPVRLQVAGQKSGTTTSDGSDSDGFPVGITVAVVLVVIVGAATLVVSRRRSAGK
jgi:hypothetical protein